MTTEKTTDGSDAGPASKGTDSEDWKAVAAALVDENRGNTKTALEREVRKNYQLRAKNRELAAKIAPDGAVILTGDDAALWTGYKALGVKPDDVKAQLAERDGLVAEKGYRKVADQIGADPDVFADLARTNGLTIAAHEAEVEDDKGTKTKQMLPHVVTGSGAQQRYELVTDVLARDFAKYGPALFPAEQAGGTSQGTGSSSNGHGTPRPTGVRLPITSSAKSGGASSSGERKGPGTATVQAALDGKYALPATK